MDTEGFGKILKKTREQNGLSIKQVAVAIKINALVLENIENENFDELPKPVFTRGFVKTYCKYLDLDENEILKKFDSQTQFISNTAKRAELPDTPTNKTPLFLLISKTIIPLIIIGVLVASGYGVFLITQKYQSEVSVVKTDDIHAIHTANDTTSSPDGTTPNTETATGDSKELSATPDGNTSVASTPKTGLTQTIKAESTVSDAEITQRLTLEPSAKTLVQIQIDDEEVQKIILRPDVNRTFQAKKRIKLSISDAGAVNIIYNRKDLGVLGVLGQSLDLEFPDTKTQK